jgi:hypothetical protein
LYRESPGAFLTLRWSNCDTHGKINCLTLKVNTFFGIPVNYDIPETELSQPTKVTGIFLKTTPYDQ